MEVLQFIFFVSFFSIIPFHFWFNHLFRHISYTNFFTVICSCLAMVMFVLIVNISLQYITYPESRKDGYFIMYLIIILYSLFTQLIYIAIFILLKIMKRVAKKQSM